MLRAVCGNTGPDRCSHLGGVVLPRRWPKEHTAESTPEDTLSRDLAALMNYGREEDNDEI